MEKQFEKIGAGFRRTQSRRLAVNVLEDKKGATFTLSAEDDVEAQVLHVDGPDRHLVLLLRDGDGTKTRFLCGHDERHYFVAAIPEATPVTTVRDAKLALMPDQVRDRPLSRRERNRRRTSEFTRQGEWFFIPQPHFSLGDMPVYKNEPIRRGGGKPHMIEELCRVGGETVYVNRQHAPNGWTQGEFDRRTRDNPDLRKLGWSTMRRDAHVFVRGKVSHSDHATIELHGWHLVVPNTEGRAMAMERVAFLD